MAIIGISGYAGSGKDTVGQLIQIATSKRLLEEKPFEVLVQDHQEHQWWLEYQSRWEIKKWAGKLKEVASILTGIPVMEFEDQKFKHTALGREWCYPIEWQGREHWVEMTVREFLQRLGTEGLRNGLHPNTWVNALMADYKPGPFYTEAPAEDDTKLPNWIITDTRFPNEAQAIKNAGGIVIRVDRPGIKAINDHPSETGLDDWDFDYKIWNGSDLKSLMFTITNILQKENTWLRK